MLFMIPLSERCGDMLCSFSYVLTIRIAFTIPA